MSVSFQYKLYHVQKLGMELLDLFLNIHFLDDSETCLMLAVRPGKKISCSQAVLPTLDQSHAHGGGTRRRTTRRRSTCRRITRRSTIRGGVLAGGSHAGGLFTEEYLPEDHSPEEYSPQNIFQELSTKG
jgi:hypothetical protein